MRDISTDDLIRTLCISIERRVRAEDILKLETSAKHASTVNARIRDERNALRALNTHFKDCIKVAKQLPGKTPAPLKRKLTGRTINALRNHGIKHPEGSTVESLLRIPGVGVTGVAAIAARSYAPPSGRVHWPELEE
jgi:hypothetical protein